MRNASAPTAPAQLKDVSTATVNKRNARMLRWNAVFFSPLETFTDKICKLDRLACQVTRRFILWAHIDRSSAFDSEVIPLRSSK
jgi:hypothetical protein